MDSPFPPRSWDGIDDIVIVGGGVAGLCCALKLSHRAVTLVTASPLGARANDECCDAVAGIADGAGLADAAIARSIASEAPKRLEELSFSAGGAARMLPALIEAVRRAPSIRVMEGYVAEQLRIEGQYVTGLVARDRRGGLSDRLHFPTRAVVLASGGVGHLYEIATNSPQSRGEGLAMAARAGALIADPEFVEFVLAFDIGLDPAPAVPAALLAEATPLNTAPSRGILTATRGGMSAAIDCRAIRDFAKNFPGVAKTCRAAGVDPAAGPIPVAAAARFHLGGVHVDGAGRTTLDGFWACGEAASTGMHGADLHPPAALAEAIVLAARVAEDLDGQLPRQKIRRWAEAAAGGESMPAEREDEAMRTLRETMSRHVGALRDGPGLAEALTTFDALAPRMRSPGARNALAAARLIASAALARKESRGVHQRSDFPAADDTASRTFTAIGPGRAGGR